MAAERCRENFALNGLHGAVVHQLAVGRDPGPVQFLVFDVASSIDHETDRKGTIIEVEVARLDDAVRGSGFAAAKIDVEGVEHLEDQFAFVRECWRVLKPGGRLLLSTPNILGLASRWRYFWTGFFPLGGAYSGQGPDFSPAGLLDLAYHAFLPALSIVLAGVGFWALGMRGAMIGVLGEDPFGAYLDETVRGERVGKRPLAIARYARVEDVDACQVLFVSRSETARLEQILAQLRGRSILTVGDTEGFVHRGGMVGFVLQGGRVRLRIDADAARAADLSISSKLLRVAELESSPEPRR